ncbi:phosphoadenylyl-sulfate reductase [Meiothermus sp. QL-1]|uniref:phosphoadenylyl-sulfate reductase n=1 Tax=Meiothermus sp. QL-1 TaxID=2058095 RepID=UPI000E0A5B28|nr:phosphoadenylyl-sulfate reductase [Meiothermus sp. QL-1]RDI94467.1 phosphoadenylyl-sulfate reductase [Meiothermus sp. QL-1]
MSPDWNENTHPQEVIRWALETYPDLLMPSGFNLNGVVLIDLAYQAGYRGEVVFVDTGYHFHETLQTRDRLAERYTGLRFVTLSAGLGPEEWGQERYRTDPDGCCAVRKVAPLQAYLEQKKPSALLNARSREQAPTRAHLGFVEPGERVRINPLAYWSKEQLEAYAKAQGLPVNPLYWSGFLSIGCWPCTRAVRPGEALRAGRWEGRGKSECGLWVGKNAI